MLLSVAPAWVIDDGKSAFSEGRDIALDDLGNLYVVGLFNDQTDFDGDGTVELTSAGSTDIYTAKFTSAGDFVWAQRMGGSELDRGRSIAVDSAGNAYVTGTFRSSADFGSTQLTASGGTEDAFVTKLDTNGNFEWTSQISGSDEADAWNIATDDTSVYVVGDVNADGYVTKLDTTNGNSLWTRTLAGNGASTARGVALDGSGDLYVNGSFSKRMNLDGIRLRSAGEGDIFLTKMTAQGGFVWGKSAGGSDGDQADAVAVDTDGNLYLTGSFKGTADFGGLALTSSGSQDIFVWKTDSSGNSAWVQQAGGDAVSTLSTDRGNHIAVGADGDLFVSGIFRETADFGTDQLISAGGWDGFFWNLDTAGNHVAAWRMGGTSSGEEPGGIDLDEAGNAYLTGSYRGTADFPTGDILTVSGNEDMFLMKFSAGPALPGIAITPTSPAETTEGGGTATFEVTLTTAPQTGETVTVTVSSDDPSEGTAAPSPLIFDEFNWDTAQVVTVTGQDDPDLDGDIAYAVDLVASSGDPAYNGLTNAVSLTNLDDEAPAVLEVTGIAPNSMQKGTTISVTISGTGFQAGASVVFENFAGPDPTASNVVVVDSSTITADVTSGNGGPNKNRVGNVRVTNLDSSTDSCVDCFTVLVSAGASAFAAASESTAASLDASTSVASMQGNDAQDSQNAPAPMPTSSGAASGSAGQSSHGASAVAANSDESVDVALSELTPGPIDAALLESLAVSLVG